MLEKFLMKRAFNMSRRLRFYRTMARQTDNTKRGVKPVLVLKSLIRNEEKLRGKQTSLSKLYRHIRNRLEMGNLMGEVLQEFAPSAETSQIYAAEKSGKINYGFTMASEIAKQNASFKKAFKDALITPIIQLSMAIFVMGLFFGRLVPAMSASLDPTKISSYSSLMVTLSEYFYPVLFTILTTIAILTAWTIWAIPNYNGNLRVKLDKIPPFSMYRLMIGCSFLYAMNSLMKSGMPQSQALTTINKSAGPYLKFRISKIIKQTERSIGEALINMQMGFPDDEIINEIAMSSEQGVLAEAMPEIVSNLSADGLELIQQQANLAKAFAFTLLVSAILFLLLGLSSFMMDMLAVSGI